MNGTTTSWNDTQKILAFVIVIAFIVVILLWMFFPPGGTQGTLAVLNTLVGALVGMAGMVGTFYFGSSRGERNKDNTIVSLSQTPPAPPAATPSSSSPTPAG